MSAPKSWREEQDEIVLRIDAALARRRRERIVRKIQQVAKCHRPGEGRVILRRISNYLKNENCHL